MNKEELRAVLENHRKWLEDDGGERANLRDADLRGANLRFSDLENADLSGADLRDADLRSTDLRGANLEHADLCGADIDFTHLNISCKGLNFKIDNRIAKQLMYHVVSLMQHSDLDVSLWFKKKLFKDLEESHVVTKHDMPKLKE